MQAALMTVFGATGRQGGAVLRAVQATPGWRVRAVTRRPGSVAARALAAQGVELCCADLDAPDSLVPALRGAQAVFGVTNFWEHLDGERELRQAIALARALATTCPQAHRIWSTLEDTRAVLRPAPGQRFAVPHMDAKAEANPLFLEGGAPATLLLTSFYWENLLPPGLGLTRTEDGMLELALPLGTATLAGVAVDDLGAVVAALLAQRPTQRRLGVAGEHLQGASMAAVLAEVLGEPVRWRDVPLPVFANLPWTGAAELAAMFAFKQRAQAGYREVRDVAAVKALHPGLLDFRGWALAHRGALRTGLARAAPGAGR